MIQETTSKCPYHRDNFNLTS